MSDREEGGEPLPISALNHLLYCERRCALIHIEGVFVENVYTLEGSQLHQIADTPGYQTRSGVRSVRALPLFSTRLRLVGKADIIEFSVDEQGREAPFPVDYKRGVRKKWDNDEVQLCAQALCLEEMLGLPVPAGAIFHAASKRRRDVLFTPSLRELTVSSVRRLHALIGSRVTPKASRKPQCEGCSLQPLCLPDLSEDQVSQGADRLFQT